MFFYGPAGHHVKTFYNNLKWNILYRCSSTEFSRVFLACVEHSLLLSSDYMYLLIVDINFYTFHLIIYWIIAHS